VTEWAAVAGTLGGVVLGGFMSLIAVWHQDRLRQREGDRERRRTYAADRIAAYAALVAACTRVGEKVSSDLSIERIRQEMDEVCVEVRGLLTFAVENRHLLAREDFEAIVPRLAGASAAASQLLLAMSALQAQARGAPMATDAPDVAAAVKAMCDRWVGVTGLAEAMHARQCDAHHSRMESNH
jgi:hypothetical protein